MWSEAFILFHFLCVKLIISWIPPFCPRQNILQDYIRDLIQSILKFYNITSNKPQETDSQNNRVKKQFLYHENYIR